MQPDITNKIAEMEKKIDAIYISVEKTRKYILWTAISTVVVFVLPLIVFALVVPSLLSNYTDMINTLGV